MILDIYSRYVVGWMLATRESAALAEKLIADTCAKQVIGPDQLTLHVDRGSSMTSQPVAFLFSPCSDRQGEGELKAWFHV